MLGGRVREFVLVLVLVLVLVRVHLLLRLRLILILHPCTRISAYPKQYPPGQTAGLPSAARSSQLPGQPETHWQWQWEHSRQVVYRPGR